MYYPTEHVEQMCILDSSILLVMLITVCNDGSPALALSAVLAGSVYLLVAKIAPVAPLRVISLVTGLTLYALGVYWVRCVIISLIGMYVATLKTQPNSGCARE